MTDELLLAGVESRAARGILEGLAPARSAGSGVGAGAVLLVGVVSGGPELLQSLAVRGRD